MRPGVGIATSALAIVLFAGDASRPWPRAVLGGEAIVTAAALSLDRGDPRRRGVGPLRFVEGWTLSSPDPAFGGFSAMIVDGRRFLFVGDGGGVVRLTLSRDGRIADPAFGDLTQGPGDGADKEGRDAEAVAQAAGGDIWVAFERSNAIARYDPTLTMMRGFARPAAMAGWPDNAGAEAIVALPGGGAIVIAEGGRRPDGSRPALGFLGDPAVAGTPVVGFGVRPPENYRVTDAALLPDGRLIALHRRIAPRRIRLARQGGRIILSGGIESAVALYDVRGVSEGAVVTAQPIATLAHPLNVDNFEGIAVAREGDALALWIVSDDNRRRFQRTILMKFLLDDVPGDPGGLVRPRPTS